LTADVDLRDVTEEDLPILFEHQDDPEASRMAAFPARDREAFIEHWKKKVLGDPAVYKKAILFGGDLVGNLVSFERDGVREVGYMIARAHWGKGIASEALRQFLAFVHERPLYGRVAKHNPASIRVLEKSGFVILREEKGVPYEGHKITDVILTLDR